MRRLLPVLFCVAAACAEPEDEQVVETNPQAALAARHACASEELATQAADDLETLQSGFAGGATPGGLTTFATAYLQHAQLRRAAYAQTDSAFNHASDSRDSTRYAQAAQRLQIITPPAGTVESNVIESYNKKAAAILADADHPCNWKHELTDE